MRLLKKLTQSALGTKLKRAYLKWLRYCGSDESLPRCGPLPAQTMTGLLNVEVPILVSTLRRLVHEYDVDHVILLDEETKEELTSMPPEELVRRTYEPAWSDTGAYREFGQVAYAWEHRYGVFGCTSYLFLYMLTSTDPRFK